MDTSRSSDWTAHALVFSGRRDPQWTVDAGTAAELTAVWGRLARQQAPAAVPPSLGYRGVVLRAPDGRVWSAFGGTVTLEPGDARHDPGREFERRLLAGAPPGALPPVDLD
jgi:hypothetical protein